MLSECGAGMIEVPHFVYAIKAKCYFRWKHLRLCLLRLESMLSLDS